MFKISECPAKGKLCEKMLRDAIYLLDIIDKQIIEVTIEWIIQRSATSSLCFTPDFPISGKKHLCNIKNRLLKCWGGQGGNW